MVETDGSERDLASLHVAQVGQLAETGDEWEPYRLLDPSGSTVTAVSAYLRELLAAEKQASTLRSYGNDLLRWFRFLWAVDVPWNRATRREARDFTLWLMRVDKPAREHWRHRDAPDASSPS